MIHILIADPDPASRKALTLLLQHKLGTSDIIEVQDLETLIHAIVDMPLDLLLLDWRLYGSPAADICRLLEKAYPHLKIIVLSVDASDEDAAKDAGAGFVHKGAAPDDLIAQLKPLLDKKNIPDAAKEIQ